MVRLVYRARAATPSLHSAFEGYLSLECGSFTLTRALPPELLRVSFDEEESALIQQAIQQLSDFSSEINRSKRDEESTVAVFQLRKTIWGCPVRPHCQGL